MFNLKEFLIVNLIDAHSKGQFSKEKVSIMAVDYLIKGVIDTQDVERIALAVEPEMEEPTEIEPEDEGQ